jgi:hypothetical protein
MDSKESLKFNNQLIHRDLIASEKKDKAKKDVIPNEPISEKVEKMQDSDHEQIKYEVGD